MQPNILYINAHDMGRYIQPYGYPVPTPNLQRFAEDAVVFRQAFCMNPTCSPSRAALLTGMAPHNNGMLGLAHLGWSLNDYGQHWVHALHAAGYASYFTGGQHISAGGRDGMESNRRIGYQNILEAIGQGAWAERLVKLFTEEKPAGPWYAEIGFSDCHRHAKWFPPAQSADDPRFVRAPAPLPDEPRTRREFAGYCSLARQFDLHVGQILGALEASGLADNTYVILTTDHGIDFPHMKCTLRDDGIGVFLMIRGPRGGAWRGGRIIDALVSQIDVFPTLCDWSGATPPAWLQGHSLTPLVTGASGTIRDEIQAEINYHAAYQPTRAVRTARWKYIRRFYQRRIPIPPNQSPCHSRDIWEEHDWFRRDEPREELYDLIYDPGEAANLADSPAHAGALAEMRGRLDRWMRTTDDPLLRGHIPLIEGGRTVAWDDPSNHGRTMNAAEWNAWLKAHEPATLTERG